MNTVATSRTLNSLVVAGTGNRLARRGNSLILSYPAVARVDCSTAAPAVIY